MFRKNLRSPFESHLYTYIKILKSLKCRDTFLVERIFHSLPDKRACRSSSEICAPHPTTRALWGDAQNNQHQSKIKEHPLLRMLFYFGWGAGISFLIFARCLGICLWKHLAKIFGHRSKTAHCAVFSLRSNPIYIPTTKNKGYQMVSFIFWLGCRDSNPGNVRVRV